MNWDNVIYSNWSRFNPINPLLIWADTNRELNNFYKRSDINLTDTPKGKEKKNTMRHIVGLGLTGQLYPNSLARIYGYSKEAFDAIRDLANYRTIKKETIDDTNIDLKNNEIGIHYTDLYPNASKNDLMEYAWGITNGAPPLNDLPVTKELSKLYGYITNTK